MEKTDLEIAKKLQEEADNEVFFYFIIFYFSILHINYKKKKIVQKLKEKRDQKKLKDKIQNLLKRYKLKKKKNIKKKRKLKLKIVN